MVEAVIWVVLLLFTLAVTGNAVSHIVSRKRGENTHPVIMSIVAVLFIGSCVAVFPW